MTQIKIYADVFFLVNAYIDFLLLIIVKRFFHLNAKGIRLFAASIFGALSSCTVLFSFSAILNLLLLLLSLITINLIAFGFKNLIFTLKNSVCYLILSILFSGLNLFLIENFKIKALIIKGKVYYDIDLYFFIFFSLIFYLLFLILEKVKNFKSEKKLFYKAEINLLGDSLETLCKLDTCNELKEPFSGDPVIVIENNDLKSKLNNENRNLRLIPYRTISGKGLLTAYKAENIKIDGKIINKSVYVAFSEEKTGKNYSGIIPESLLN